MIGALIQALRYVLTFCGGVALLFVLSYPDTVLPPSLDVEYVKGLTVYDFKPVMWCLPLLFMELVSSMGPQRNKVWFTCLGAVWVCGVIAWPVLQAHVPEWVERTLPFEDGKLPVGLGYMAIIIFGSVLFRCVLLSFLFKAPRSEEEDPTMMDADILDPAKGRTVREIMANPTLARPRFLFGEADHALINRFYALVRRMRQLRYAKQILCGLAVLALGVWFFCYPQPTEQQALQRDLAAMYECRQLPGGGYIGTRRAVHAAYRVMRYVEKHDVLDGMSFAAAERWLGVSRAPQAYRRRLLDRSDISLASVDDMFESRLRFFTVQDGRHTVVLYVRTDESGQKITVAEVQDAGWNAIVDEARRRFGQDVSAKSFL